MEFPKFIRECFAPSPEANQRANQSRGVTREPEVEICATEDGWTLYAYPAPETLTPEDRAALWQFLAEEAAVAVQQEVPGCAVRVIPPGQFINGQPAEGIVQYSFPAPDGSAPNRLQERFWWREVCSVLPRVSDVVTQRLGHHLRQQRVRSSPLRQPTPARPTTRRGIRR